MLDCKVYTLKRFNCIAFQSLSKFKIAKTLTNPYSNKKVLNMAYENSSDIIKYHSMSSI